MTRFMIVDDSIFQRKNLGKMVSLIGGEVIAEASTGREAVDLYRTLGPDLVLMDLVMPEMEGVEAVEKILEFDTKAKIVVISSIGYEEVVNRALSLGAKHFLPKPVDINQAANVIMSVLEGR
jgi:two-component system chemotaxis response regulator CheY